MFGMTSVMHLMGTILDTTMEMVITTMRIGPATDRLIGLILVMGIGSTRRKETAGMVDGLSEVLLRELLVMRSSSFLCGEPRVR